MKKRLSIDQDNDYFSADQQDGILIIRFKGNPLINSTQWMLRGLVTDYFNLISTHPDVKVVVVHRSTDSPDREQFLAFYERVFQAKLLKSDVAKMFRTIDQVILDIVESNKIFIGVESGPVIAQFFNIRLACDYRIVADDLVVQNPALELGLVAKGGSAFFLSRLIGRSRALNTLLGRQEIGAQDALSLGMVDQVAPLAHLDRAVMDAAQRFARLPASSLRATKRFLSYDYRGLRDYLEFENRELLNILTHRGVFVDP
jgi:enoyl-CoA hydratase/carnithine racemase